MEIEQEIKVYKNKKLKDYYQDWYTKNKDQRNMKRRIDPERVLPRKNRKQEDISIMGRRIKELREQNNMMQKDLADMLNLSPNAIGSYELSEREPKIKTLIELSKIFNVSIDYLVGNDKDGN